MTSTLMCAGVAAVVVIAVVVVAAAAVEGEVGLGVAGGGNGDCGNLDDDGVACGGCDVVL